MAVYHHSELHFARVDRGEAENDYRINVQAELENELLHEKLDMLRESEFAVLTRAVEALSVKRGRVV